MQSSFASHGLLRLPSLQALLTQTPSAQSGLVAQAPLVADLAQMPAVQTAVVQSALPAHGPVEPACWHRPPVHRPVEQSAGA
jgi:hypothetical protein